MVFFSVYLALFLSCFNLECMSLLERSVWLWSNDKVLTINSAYLHQYNFTKMISLRDVKASTVYYFKTFLHNLCKFSMWTFFLKKIQAGDVLAFNYTFTYKVSFVVNIIVHILSYVSGYVWYRRILLWSFHTHVLTWLGLVHQPLQFHYNRATHMMVCPLVGNYLFRSSKSLLSATFHLTSYCCLYCLSTDQ